MIDFIGTILITATGKNKIYHMDISENITCINSNLKSHFNKSQYSLYIAPLSTGIIIIVTFITYLMKQLLTIFFKFPIKCDNAASQYKNKWLFYYYRMLAMKQKKKVVSGHGKGLADAMSGFGVKGPLKKAVLTEDFSFSSAEDIYNYVQERFQFDTKKNHFMLSVDSIAENRKFDGSLKIEGCRDIHVIAFSPDGTVATKINICSCSSCIIGEFQKCLEEKGKLIFRKYMDVNQRNLMILNPNYLSYDLKTSLVSYQKALSLPFIHHHHHLNFFTYVKSSTAGLPPNLIDQNEHVVPVGARYIKCKYFEKKREAKCRVYYNLLQYDVYDLHKL